MTIEYNYVIVERIAMIQPKASYRLFGRLAVKKRPIRSSARIWVEEDCQCLKDITERDRDRRGQLADRGRQRIMRELRKLEVNPVRRYDHLVFHNHPGSHISNSGTGPQNFFLGPAHLIHLTFFAVLSVLSKDAL